MTPENEKATRRKARMINRALTPSAMRGNPNGVYFVDADTPDYPIRITRARTRHGILSVRTLSHGQWLTVKPGDSIEIR
jgi:hypothetical protein